MRDSSLHCPERKIRGSRGLLPEASHERLEQCLGAELSAVATYDLALTRKDSQKLAWTLLHLRILHGARAQSIVRYLTNRGVAPRPAMVARNSIADVLCGRTLLAGLEELEERVLARYERDDAALDGSTRRFVDARLLPDQKRSRELLASNVAQAAMTAAAGSLEVAA
jgi:hypothetical protein